jgi:hypothetical protein
VIVAEVVVIIHSEEEEDLVTFGYHIYMMKVEKCQNPYS